MIKVLMVDDNVNLINATREYFSKNNKIEIVYEAHDGLEGYEILKEHHDEIDLVILDLIMPKKDGIYFLQNMRKDNIDKKVVVESSYNSTEIIREVSEFGVTYYLLKPYAMEDLEDKIISVLNKNYTKKTLNLHANNLNNELTKLLHELGIPSHIKGYQYIKEAILMIYENTNYIGGITKELYPELGIKFDTTVSRVERAIRHAIEISWNRGSWDLMELLFGNSIDSEKGKPTNSEFLVTIADKIRMDCMA